jgi:hypothetical protein
MLKFTVYRDGKPANAINLSGAYCIGADDVPLRAEVSAKNGVIFCEKRAGGPAGLSLLWTVKGVGEVMLETVRLMEREQPYILTVELARGRLMRINAKLEDWGILDHEDGIAIAQMLDDARESLIKALQADDADGASRWGDEALRQAVIASGELSRVHADLFVTRRRETGGFSRRVFGCSIHADATSPLACQRIKESFDFAMVPLVWRDIEPSEQKFQWDKLDAWVEALARQDVPMHGAPLLSFAESQTPDWLHTWSQDFDTIRDLAFEHARRLINRYGQHIQTWHVASGLHANTTFAFNFEQLMELTRMTSALAHQLAPRGTTVLDIVAPWGEYYARNQRTIPPLLYAEMAVQSGINFDAFGLQFFFGPGQDGMYVRDMFQISVMLDHFLRFAKPVRITGIQVPSSTAHAKTDAVLNGGVWREPWSEAIQADWMEQFIDVALSKPFVESVAWHGLADHANQPVPHGAIMRSDLTPKPAAERLAAFRSEVHAHARQTPA